LLLLSNSIDRGTHPLTFLDTHGTEKLLVNRLHTFTRTLLSESS
jgi:hypothetical protein